MQSNAADAAPDDGRNAGPPLVFLLGPTASGKTAIGIALCQAMPCQLISVDSSLVYRGMDVGTAKPSVEEQAVAPHRLIDICDPWQTYSAAQFCNDARREIDAARAAGKVPVLIGGTMLYFNALEKGLASMPPADQATRDRLSERARDIGWPALHQELVEVDPEAAARIHPNDPQRIQRALEVHALSGRRISQWQATDKGQALDCPLLKIGLYPIQRSELHRRIELRFGRMLEQGFLDEMRALMAHPLIDAQLPSMRSVGYRQAWRHLEGNISLSEMTQLALAATRQLAKRQLTWMRAMDSLQLVDSVEQSVESIVQNVTDSITF